MEMTANNTTISTKPVQEKGRNSTIELLRIIAMMMIVFCHFATHGGFVFGAQEISIPRFWWGLLEMGGNVGVNIFVLISGYFLIDNKRFFDFRRILKFWGQVFFYSIVIYVICAVSGVTKFGIESLIKSFFPITFSAWWFASAYFVLYLIHPFINMLLHKLDKATFQKLLLMLLILWCIIPTFIQSGYESNYLLWFITLYCVASYVRLFDLNIKFTTKRWFWMFIIFSMLRYLSYVLLVLLGTKISIAYDNTLFFYKQQSILTFLSALSLFMTFIKMKVKNNKLINVIASASFGVYLIHDSNIIRSLLWLDFFKNSQYQNTVMIIPISIGIVFAVYLVCTIVDLIRQQTIEKLYMFVVTKIHNYLLKPFRAICDFFKNVLFGK